MHQVTTLHVMTKRSQKEKKTSLVILKAVMNKTSPVTLKKVMNMMNKTKSGITLTLNIQH